MCIELLAALFGTTHPIVATFANLMMQSFAIRVSVTDVASVTLTEQAPPGVSCTVTFA
jgi:hypothetical protein